MCTLVRDRTHQPVLFSLAISCILSSSQWSFLMSSLNVISLPQNKLKTKTVAILFITQGS